jgi:hypothetical protein
MWLPDRLYELLPHVYAIASFGTAVYFDTRVGFAAGFLPLLTAALVWMMRRDDRQGQGDRKN